MFEYRGLILKLAALGSSTLGLWLASSAGALASEDWLMVDHNEPLARAESGDEAAGRWFDGIDVKTSVREDYFSTNADNQVPAYRSYPIEQQYYITESEGFWRANAFHLRLLSLTEKRSKGGAFVYRFDLAESDNPDDFCTITARPLEGWDAVSRYQSFLAKRTHEFGHSFFLNFILIGDERTTPCFLSPSGQRLAFDYIAVSVLVKHPSRYTAVANRSFVSPDLALHFFIDRYLADEKLRLNKAMAFNRDLELDWSAFTSAVSPGLSLKLAPAK